MPKMIMVETQLAKEAAQVLDDLGLDIDVAVKMLLKRIVREKGISFLTAYGEGQAASQKREIQQETSPAATDAQLERSMTKNQAVALFKAQGVCFNRNITFSSKNRSAYNYWANPNFAVLEDNWFLILNDWERKELHLFCIPAKTFSPSELVRRSDLPDKVDLQICYNDPTYTDNRSKISFAKYLMKRLNY